VTNPVVIPVPLTDQQRAIQNLVWDGYEDEARDRYGNDTVDAYFRYVENADPDTERIDFDELTRRLDDIGADICALALSIGLPDPGAAKAEDLMREMWARVHAHDAELGVHVDEGRALGWHA
jgi:hypothetical protein